MMNLASNLFSMAVEANWARLGSPYRDYGSVEVFTSFELVIILMLIVFVTISFGYRYVDAEKKKKERRAREMEKELGDTEILFLRRQAENDHRRTQNVLWFELMAQNVPEFEWVPADPQD